MLFYTKGVRAFSLVLLFGMLSSYLAELKAASTDSLRAVVAEHPNDTSGANALIQLSRSFFRTDLDSSIMIGNRAKALSLELDNDELLAQSENALGIARLFQGDHDGSLIHFEEVLRIRERQEIPDLIAKANNNVALSHQGMGNYSLALDYHFRSLKIKEDLGDSVSIRVSYVNIGLIYHQLKDYLSARRYYRQTLNMMPLEEDSVGYATNVFNIGSTYFNEKQNDSARYWFSQSFPVVRALGDQRMIGLHYLNLGQIDQREGRYGKAEEGISRSLEIFHSLGKPDQIVVAWTALGSNYLQKGFPKEAKDYCSKGLSLARELGDLSKEAACLECLHEASAKLGRSEEAYQHLVLYSALRDSLNSEDIHKQIVRKDLANAFKKEQLADSLEAARTNELLTLQYENEQDKLFSFALFLTIIGILLVGVVLLLVFILRNKHRQGRILEERVNRRTEVLEKQKDQLAEYAFINAHLMRQPLTQIMGLIPLIQMADDEVERAQYLNYLQQSSQKLDDVIHEVRDLVENPDNR